MYIKQKGHNATVHLNIRSKNLKKLSKNRDLDFYINWNTVELNG